MIDYLVRYQVWVAVAVMVFLALWMVRATLRSK